MAAEKTDDLNLPTSIVTRIIKDALPEGCNVAKEAKLALARAASVFVLYLTAQANNVATERNKKTIANQDVLKALEITEFGRFEDPLKEALEQFKRVQRDKKDRKQSKEGDKMDVDDDQNEEDVEELEASADVEIEEDPHETS